MKNLPSEDVSLYRSPQWTLVIEVYLALQAIGVGYSGSLFASGPLANLLYYQGDSILWATLFMGFGFTLLMTSVVELRHRCNSVPRYMLDQRCRTRFAIAREFMNFLLIGCWLYALVILLDHESYLTGVIFTAAQAVCFHAIAFRENVKAQHVPFEDKRRNLSMG